MAKWPAIGISTAAASWSGGGTRKLIARRAAPKRYDPYPHYGGPASRAGLPHLAGDLVNHFLRGRAFARLAAEILGRSATPETVAAFRTTGVDLPAHVRYSQWLGSMLQGDMGVSLANQRPIAALIGIGNTLFLAIMAAIIAVPVALLAFGGVVPQWRVRPRRQYLHPEYLISFPIFVAYILVFIWRQSWPVSQHFQHQPGNRILGTDLSLNLAGLDPDPGGGRPLDAHDARLDHQPAGQRLSNGPQRLKPGVSSSATLPNALAPIINVIIINLAYLIVGVVIVEVVFVCSGLDQLLVDSVSKRDLPVVQGASLLFAMTYVLLNLTADVLSILTNPRLLHPGEAR